MNSIQPFSRRVKQALTLHACSRMHTVIVPRGDLASRVWELDSRVVSQAILLDRSPGAGRRDGRRPQERRRDRVRGGVIVGKCSGVLGC